MIPEPLTVIREIGALFVKILSLAGWIGALAVFFVLLKGWRLKTKKKAAVKKIEWALLEVTMPKGNVRSPKVMESVFAGLSAVYKGDKALVQDWFSFEMTGFVGGIRFFIRTPKPHRNLIEAALFSQYPDIEITEAPEDYVKRFGKEWGDDENAAYDLAGFDLALARDPHLPIRTHPNFMESRRLEEEHVDPLGVFAEAMSNLKTDEHVWIQLLVRPTKDEWKKKGEEAILKLHGRKPEEEKPKKPEWRVAYDEIFLLVKNLVRALALQAPVWPEEKKEEKPAAKVDITEAERELAKAINGKISKIGYECAIRCLYLDKKDAFTKSNVTAVAGAFKQFDTPTGNSFKPISGTGIPSEAKWFQERKIRKRKEELFEKYVKRDFPDLDKDMKRPILNIEELATLFHPPVAELVAASGLQNVELKKGMPPSNLPFIVEEARG